MKSVKLVSFCLLFAFSGFNRLFFCFTLLSEFSFFSQLFRTLRINQRIDHADYEHKS